jgi:soluble lytic murein transglycosylase
MLKIRIIFLLLILTLPSSPAWAKDKKQEPHPAGPQVLTYLILSGQYHEALDQLGQPKKSAGDWKNRLHFMAAYLNYRKGDYKKAAKLFEELKGDYAILQDYVDYYRALALRESGQAKEAIVVLGDLKGKSISPTLAKKLNRDLALSYCKAGDRKAAIDILNGMIQTEGSDIKAYHLQFDRSKCLIELRSPEEAVVTLRSLYLNYPEGDLSDEIRKTLADMGQSHVLSTADLIQRGDQLMRNNRPSLAAADYQAIIAQQGAGASPHLQLKLADAYFESRQYPLAAQAFETLERSAPGLFDQKTRLRLAQSYARSDQFDQAIAAYQNLAALGDEGQEDKWDFKIAFLYMDKGDYGKANQLFEEILTQNPRHPNRDQILWYLAWNHQLLKNYDRALSYFNLLEESYPGSRFSDRVPYWRARILEKQGKTREAETRFKAISDQDPFSYYGFLSLKRLNGTWEPTVPPKNSWAGSLPRRHLPNAFSMSQLEKKGKKQAMRVRELLWLGLWEDFLGELAQLTGEEAPYELQNLQRRIQDAAPEVATNGGEGFEDGYPPAYPTLVTLFSKTRDFPPALTWAIMREESRFRPAVVSPAQAIGLMQIIPPTGSEIARDLGRQGFVPEQLYQPVTNIEFGVHYLNKNRARFGGALPQTIASYNAGPDAVERWIRARPGREWDEFVEEIPYKETNNYVKKVMKSYYIYQLMYEGD